VSSGSGWVTGGKWIRACFLKQHSTATGRAPLRTTRCVPLHLPRPAYTPTLHRRIFLSFISAPTCLVRRHICVHACTHAQSLTVSLFACVVKHIGFQRARGMEEADHWRKWSFGFDYTYLHLYIQRTYIAFLCLYQYYTIPPPTTPMPWICCHHTRKQSL
jgi:hypothetical protein